MCSDVSDLEKGLTDDVERVARWIEANKLRLNVTKTNLLLTSRKRRMHELEQVKVKVNYQELVKSKKVKCLGVVLDDGLMWKEQVVNVRRKCFAGLAKLRRAKDILPSDTKRKIYYAIILPHLDYCCVVWQECSLEL